MHEWPNDYLNGDIIQQGLLTSLSANHALSLQEKFKLTQDLSQFDF